MRTRRSPPGRSRTSSAREVATQSADIAYLWSADTHATGWLFSDTDDVPAIEREEATTPS